MGLFSRLGTLIRSNINELINKAEDPELWGGKLWTSYITAFMFALALGLVPALVRGLSRLSGEREQARSLERDAARFALYAMVAVVVLEAAPVVRYLVVSGGVSVFGV